MRQDQEREVLAQIEAGEKTPEALDNLPLPVLPYVRRVTVLFKMQSSSLL